MRAATDRVAALLTAAGVLAGLLLAAVLTASPARAEEAAPAEGKPCCHKSPAPAEAALPAGMTELGADAPTPGRAVGSAAATVTLAEARLVDQDGRPRRFPAEVLGDRIVVMDFVFTTCTTICPILSAKLAQLQARLGDRAGRDVQLVSISIDPARDTPARLKAFGARHQAGPGWTWLTGGTAEVERVLKGLGAYTPAFTEHAPMMLVGDGRTGRFLRLNGFPGPDQLLAAVDQLLQARGPPAGAGAGGAP